MWCEWLTMPIEATMRYTRVVHRPNEWQMKTDGHKRKRMCDAVVGIQCHADNNEFVIFADSSLTEMFRIFVWTFRAAWIIIHSYGRCGLHTARVSIQSNREPKGRRYARSFISIMRRMDFLCKRKLCFFSDSVFSLDFSVSTVSVRMNNIWASPHIHIHIHTRTHIASVNEGVYWMVGLAAFVRYCRLLSMIRQHIVDVAVRLRLV